MKVDADEDLLEHLERGIRGLKGVTESTGQCSVRHVRDNADGMGLAVLLL